MTICIRKSFSITASVRAISTPCTDANRAGEGYNPLCGDKLKLFLKMDGDTVREASFTGSGCAISTASASLMTESLKGKTRERGAAPAR